MAGPTYADIGVAEYKCMKGRVLTWEAGDPLRLALAVLTTSHTQALAVLVR